MNVLRAGKPTFREVPLRERPHHERTGLKMGKKLPILAAAVVLGGYAISNMGGTEAVPVAIPAAAPVAPVAPVTLDADAVQGHVLPFKIITAIRNFGFPKAEILAQISVSVEGGNPADWMATGIYIAEHSIVNGAAYSVTEVYVQNPWGELPPTRFKKLAQVYYSPDPSHSPWNEFGPWSIFTAAKAGTLADIEFDKLGNDLLSDKISDPDKRMATADAQARRSVIQKYKLSAKWKPTEGLGLTGTVYYRGHVDVVAGPDIYVSMQELASCLTSNGGNPIFKGCNSAGRP